MTRQNVEARIGKEDYNKMKQDGPEAQTWTDFEEDCEAVKRARASKINDSGCSAYQVCFRQDSSTGGRCRFGVWSRPRRSQPAADRRIATGTVDDCETHCPAGKSGLGPQTSMETSPAPRSGTPQGRTGCWTTPFGSGYVERMQPRNQQTLFGTRAWSSATR